MHITHFIYFGLHISSGCGVFFYISLLKSSEYLILQFNILKVATSAFVPVVIYTLVAGMGTTSFSTFMSLAFLVALMIRKQEPL